MRDNLRQNRDLGLCAAVSDRRPSFWTNKRVLITGQTGFKGSWLSLWLEMLDASVIGYGLEPPTQPNLFEDARVGDGTTSTLAEICDLDQLCRAFHTFQPEIVFHLAAQALVRQSYLEPVETFATNVMGTVNVLEAARRSPSVRVVLVVTSDKCYENKEWLYGYRENEPLGGRDVYSSSKACSELVTAAYRASFFSTDGSPVVATARAGNVIGGGDWAKDRLIPDIMKSIRDGRYVQIRSPNAVRPWQHVLEPLHGYLLLAQALWDDKQRFAGPWNFGPDEDSTRSVSWILDAIAGVCGQMPRVRVDQSEQSLEAIHLKLDSTKARTQLGWTPRLDLPTALRWTTEWYLQYNDNEDPRTLTLDNIKGYQKMLEHGVKKDSLVGATVGPKTQRNSGGIIL